MSSSLRNRLLNGFLIVLILALLTIVAIRFGLVKGAEVNVKSFKIEDISTVDVLDMNGGILRLIDLLSKDGSTYMLLFDSNDCPSCIYVGLEDLKQLKKGGQEAFALMIHESLAEARTFASVNEVEQFLTLAKVAFYENFQCALTPVIVKFKKGEVSSYRYIKP